MVFVCKRFNENVFGAVLYRRVTVISCPAYASVFSHEQRTDFRILQSRETLIQRCALSGWVIFCLTIGSGHVMLLTVIGRCFLREEKVQTDDSNAMMMSSELVRHDRVPSLRFDFKVNLSSRLPSFVSSAVVISVFIGRLIGRASGRLSRGHGLVSES